MNRIPITKPYFGPEEFAAVQIPLETGWLVQGPHVARFEQMFAAFTGVRHAVATSSCTTALHVAVAALKLQPGDEVIVPAFTWVATPNAVEYMGGRPVFCDIDLRTFNIDTAQIESLVSPRTVGIVPVHLFGLCADMDPIRAIAKRHGLWVVEDAACALGAYYGGSHAGAFGDMACFSFHPRKSVTTGEGGMVTTARDDLRDLTAALRDHGAFRSNRARHDGPSAFVLPDVPLLGYNYRMTDMQGALGCAQMDRASWLLGQRAAKARLYDELLQAIDWLRTPETPSGLAHGYQSYVTLFCPEEPTMENLARLSAARAKVMSDLEAHGISTRPGTHAPVLLEYYACKYGLRADQFPNATAADRLSIALPLYAQLTDSEQAIVVDALRSAVSTVK